MEEKKVAAVVLTYNRLHLLKECIAAIQSQSSPPDAVIVIDNGSNADTGDWLQTQKSITVVSIHPNVGPAAGIKRGLQEAYERAYQWIWVMDDDGLPHREALERLLTSRPESIGAKNSIVLNKGDKKSLVFKMFNYKELGDIKGEYVDGEIMPWNGTLLHRTIIEKLGYPKTELYLWGEEAEYHYRIKNSGLFDMFSVRNSWHYHPQCNMFYRGNWDVYTNDRAYYFIRNKYIVYLSKYKQNRILASAKYIVFNAGMIYYILFYQKEQKFKKIKLQFSAAKDGFACNYTKSPPDIISAIKRL
jgi:GT2 family glycosyltransferase